MELMLLMAAVVGIIWLAVFLRATGMMGGCLLTLMTGIVFGSEFYSVGPANAGRLLLLALVGAFLLFWKIGNTDPKRLTRVEIVFGCFLAFLIFSTFTHDITFRDGRPVSRLVFFYLLPVVMYWIARNMKTGPKAVYGMFIAVAAFGIYLSLTSVAEKLGLYGLVFPSYIGSIEIEEFLGRGRGPLLNPAANGILICAGWFGMLMLWPNLQRNGRAVIVIISFVFAAGVFCTLTRCVWLGALVGLAAIVWFSFPRRVSLLLVVGATIVVVLAGPVLIQKASRFKRDKNVSIEQMVESASLRPKLAFVAWKVFLEHPVAGLGYGQYKNADRFYLSDRTTEMSLEGLRDYHQHNVFLSLLTEVGLLGMSLFAIVLLGWLSYAKRLWFSYNSPLEMRQLGLFYIALMLSYVSNGMFQDMSIVTMMNMVVFFFSGLMTGCYVKYTVDSETAVERTSATNDAKKMPGSLFPDTITH